jgi:Phage integrase, N-terminal SAM-like domain
MSDVVELVVELAEVPELFERWLAGRPLADGSRREYARNVRAYCKWLAETPDRDGWQSDPLVDPLARDHAARDFCRYLQVERRAATSTVNLALASLDALYRCLVSAALIRVVTSRRRPRRAPWMRRGSGCCCGRRRRRRSARGRW